MVDLTGGQDASFTNVDISGSLILNNIDISGKLLEIDDSLVNLASSGGTITELLDLIPNEANSSAIINQIANIFKEPWWLTYNNVFRYSPAGAGGWNNSYGAGVLTNTGRIVFIPYEATYFTSYNLDTHFFVPAAGPGGFTRVSFGRPYFRGGVLAPNGKVICIPHSSPYVGIFDPNVRAYGDYYGSYTNGVAHGKGDFAYSTGLLAQNGKIIFFPFGGSNIGIYDPSNDTLIDSSAVPDTPWHGSAAAVLLLNGKMITIPGGSNHNLGIYDPEADTWTRGPSLGQGDNAYSNGVLAPNGNVILIPAQQNRIGIYDPYDTSIGKFTLGAVITDPDPGGARYSSGVLAPNGKIIFVPYNAVHIGIYDPETDIFENGPYIGTGPQGASRHFGAGVLAPTGEIIFVPHINGIGIYGNNFPLNYKNDLLAPYF